MNISVYFTYKAIPNVRIKVEVRLISLLSIIIMTLCALNNNVLIYSIVTIISLQSPEIALHHNC